MNNMKRIVTVTLIFMMVMLFTVPALAADLNEVTFSGGKITVSGSCTTSDQVQLVVFDYNNQPVFFTTVEVAHHAFSKTLDADFNLEAGKTYTVKIADYDGENIATDTFTVAPQSPSHTHSFGSDWKSDSTNHWHECTCGEKSDTAVHTYGRWTITSNATATENGSKERTCSVCSYKETAVVTATGNSPLTGDTGNLVLWVALLFLSGGILTTLSVANRKHRKQC